MQTQPDYHFNLFQPLTEYGRKIRNLILTMLAVWAVCVFGFQILLKIVEKPTPEATLNQFEATYPAVRIGTADAAEIRSFLTSLVLVNGKNIVTPANREVLTTGINASFRLLVPDTLKEPVMAKIPEMVAMKGKLDKATGQEYLDLKTGIVRIQNELMAETAVFTGFTPGGLEATLLVNFLKNGESVGITSPALEKLPAIMKLYLTHNRSFLTDFKFLGFPFHYFYTAVFLLILFVGLCLLYNLRLDRRMKIEKIDE